MAVPKRRQSKARSRKRRSHDALIAPTYTLCTNCGALTRPHSVCTSCGTYKGVQILKVKEKKK
ncbi:50S ribosomal protein L32 [Candidatus Uabimicrobium amorphum]|uniref:50S ribosomal protein L32 n=1 Tax=Uabimicrobium amorphum TaxID=2596890 RepID=UPI00125EF26A